MESLLTRYNAAVACNLDREHLANRNKAGQETPRIIELKLSNRTTKNGELLNADSF